MGKFSGGKGTGKTLYLKNKEMTGGRWRIVISRNFSNGILLNLKSYIHLMS
jgi:hypothetical protein